MSARRVTFLFIYVLSGAAGLLYEVAWSRLLTLHMGHTVAAVSTVLAAFMGGLAAGATAAGRVAPGVSRRRALQLYGILELAIGAAALFLPIALSATGPLLSRAYADGGGGATFGLMRLATSLAMVSLPAAAMGATFPVAVRWFARSAERAGADAGGLYAANTIGGALGAALAGFVLLPVLGLRGSTMVGVAVNVMAAVVAFGLARSEPAHGESIAAERPAAPARGDSRRARRTQGRAPLEPLVARPWLAAGILAISGFVALVFEVTWTRLLALAIGPTTYAFSAMLAAFIAGLALGSGLSARLVLERRRAVAALPGSLVLAAAGAWGAAWVFDRLPLRIAQAVAAPDVHFESVLLLQTGWIAICLLPMAVGLGAAFPAAVALAANRAEAVASDVALVYTLNTLGAIAGALAGGFLLIPALGLQGTILAAGLLALAAAIWVALADGVRRGLRYALVGVAGLTAVAGFAAPEWNRELLSSGAYKYAPYLRGADLESALEAGRLLYYAEGAAGTVSVRLVAGATSLAIDGKVDASNSGDMLTQRLLAHLPLLLHPDSKEVCIIGLGSGVTLGSALRHPIARADMLEISPEVVEASRFFVGENHDALADPRTHLIVGDGRTHLLLSSRRYDVIVSEPSNPWMAGIATLFTREFFEAARGRLAPGGILCQWAHTYDISDGDLRSIVATFASVFPDGTMWMVGEGDLLLIGSTAPLEPRLAQIAAAWQRPGVAADLAGVGARDPFAVLSLYVGGRAALERYAADAAMQTDEHTMLEFSAPRSLYGRTVTDNAATIRALAGEVPRPPAVRAALDGAGARQWRDRGAMHFQAEAYRVAFEDFARAVRMDPTDAQALEGCSRAAVGARRLEEAIRLYRGLAAAPQSRPVRLELSRLLASSGRFDEAIRAAQEAVSLDPAGAGALEQLAAVLADVGDADRLDPVVEALMKAEPDRPGALYYAGTLAFLRGDFARAVAAGEQVVRADPRHHRAHNLLGAAYGNLGQSDRARQAFQASVAVNPRDPAAHVNLGIFELEAANPQAAVEHFAEALTLDPASPAALSGLADALERQGQVERARRLRDQIRRSGPAS